MTIKRFNNLRGLVILAVVALMMISVTTGYVFIGILAVLAGMVSMSFLKTAVKEKVSDERVENIDAKASRTSFKILLPIIGFTAFALIMAAGEQFDYLRSIGIILAYVTCVGLLVYLGAYFYFNKKYGG